MWSVLQFYFNFSFWDVVAFCVEAYPLFLCKYVHLHTHARARALAHTHTHTRTTLRTYIMHTYQQAFIIYAKDPEFSRD